MDIIIVILSFIFLCLYLMHKQLNLTSFVVRLAILGLLLVAIEQLFIVMQSMHFMEKFYYYTSDIYSLCTNIVLLIVAIFCFGLLLNTKEPALKNIQPVIILIGLIFLYGYTTAIKAETFFYLYLSLEISAFCTYALLGLNSKNLLSNEGAIKYFLGHSLASILFLVATSILYSLTGTTNISQISNLFFISENHYLMSFAILMIIISLVSKLALAPLHWFTIDAYQSAPIFVTALLMTVPKIALLSILYHIYCLFSSSFNYYCVLFLLLLTFFQLSIQAFGQLKLRRFVVFTMTVNNVILLAPLLIASKENSFSILPSLLSYFIPLLLLFNILCLLRNPDEKLENLSLLKNPLLILALLSSMVSFTGIPVLAGFLLKYFVFVHLLSFQDLGIIFFIVVITLIPAYYYLRFVQALYLVRNYSPEFTYFPFLDLNAKKRQTNLLWLTQMLCILLFLNIIIFVLQFESLFFLI
jgi:NADH-quinone oxidoreductase subunit N